MLSGDALRAALGQAPEGEDERTRMADAMVDRTGPMRQDLEEPEERTMMDVRAASAPVASSPRPPTRPPPAAPPVEERTRVASTPPSERGGRGGDGGGGRGDGGRGDGGRGGPKAVFSVLMGPDEGKRFILSDGVMHVGRALECEVVLNDPSASRKHFRIEGAAGRFVLIDLGSENGTCVGGTRVKKAVLEQDDQISVGTTLLHFGYAGAPGPTVTGNAGDAGRKASRVDVKAKRSAMPVVLGVSAVVLGAGVTFGGHFLGWWQLWGSPAATPAPVAQATTEAGSTDTEADGTAAGESPDEADGTGTEADGTAADVEAPAADPVADAGVAVAAVDVVTAPETPDAGALAPDAADDVAAVDPDALAAADVDSGDASALADVESGDASTLPDGAVLVAADPDATTVDGIAEADALVAATPDVNAEADAAIAVAADVALPGADFEQIVLEARLLIGEKKITEALAKAEAAQKSGAPAATVQALMKTIVAASAHKMILESQQKEIAAKNWALAVTLGQQIPSDSPYAAESAALTAEAKAAQAGTVVPAPDAVVTPEQKLLQDVKTVGTQFLEAVLAGQDKVAIEMLIAEADCAKAAPSFLEECKREVKAMQGGLEALRKELKGKKLLEVSEPDKLEGGEEWPAFTLFAVEATIASAPEPIATTVTVIQMGPALFKVTYPIQEAPAEAAQVPPTPPANPTVAEAPTPTPTPSTGVALDRMKGLRMYASGDFKGAVAYFSKAGKDATLSADDQARARTLARNIQAFEKQYGAGQSAASQLRDIAAITALSEALTLDKRIGSSYQAPIKKALATMHAHRASSQFQAGRLFEAAKAARKAVQFDKGQQGAKLILEKLSTQADALIAKAKAAKGNPAEARRHLRDAKLILPPGDGRLGAVQKMLDELPE